MKATHTTYRLDVIYTEDSVEQGSHFKSMDDKIASLARELEFMAVGVKATKGLERKILLGQNIHKLDIYDEADAMINDSVREELTYGLLKEVK